MKSIIKKYENHLVDEPTQVRLNKPLSDSSGYNVGHEEFLKALIQKIESGELNPFQADTLYNQSVYNKLSEFQKDKTDLTAINIMAIIRQIESLWKLEKKPTFQIQNLVETVFSMKSNFEKEYGDVYII